MNKKVKVMIAGAAAAGTLAVAGISYAAFARSNDVNATGTSEKFRPVTVSGKWVGGKDSVGLLPGESGDVRITVSIAGDNTVNAKVTGITPQAITADSISGVPDDQKEACAKLLRPATYVPPSLVLSKGAANVQLTLKEAVYFDKTATEACEGMSFATKWTVTFEPSRANTGLVGSGGTVDVAATSRP